jgi:DNA-binding transcriptional MerR regulator
MHTISMLRRTLGLSSDNQVRNRIDRIKDLLADQIRRGPNNQIFLTDTGLDLLKQLQELYDTGLTLTEASQVLRATAINTNIRTPASSSSFTSNQMKPSREGTFDASSAQELKRIREHLVALEERISDLQTASHTAGEDPYWWNRLREDVDVT